jgi:hypothetical protein
MSSSQSNITFQLRVASMTTCALPENGSKESSNRAVVVAHPAGTQGLAARVLNHEVAVSFVVIDTNMVRVGLGVPPVPSSVTTHGDPTSIFFAPGQPVNVVPTGDPPNPPPPAPGRSAPASPKRSSHRSGLSLKPTAFMPPPLLADAATTQRSRQGVVPPGLLCCLATLKRERAICTVAIVARALKRVVKEAGARPIWTPQRIQPRPKYVRVRQGSLISHQLRRQVAAVPLHFYSQNNRCLQTLQVPE